MGALLFRIGKPRKLWGRALQVNIIHHPDPTLFQDPARKYMLALAVNNGLQ